MEYRGRIDGQVKIRGFRVELEEIEAVLRQHADVRQVVVISRGEKPAEKRLVAYVVPARQAPTVSELNGFLRQKVPEYMVPSAFMLLDTLPLTANGKIDRRSLPVPDQNRPEQDSSFVAPRTPVEELLARIWGEVLKLERWAYMTTSSSWAVIHYHSLKLPLGSNGTFWCYYRYGFSLMRRRSPTRVRQSPQLNWGRKTRLEVARVWRS